MNTQLYLFLILTILISLFIGCQAKPIRCEYGTDTRIRDSNSVLEEPDQKILVQVPATAGWVAAGVTLEEGDQVQIYAHGTWTVYAATQWGGIGAWGYVGPAGYGDYAKGSCDAPDAPVGSLIGKIENNKPFYIGPAKKFVTESQGDLFFAINDWCNYRWDDGGAMQVTTQVQSFPHNQPKEIRADKITLNSDIDQMVRWRSSDKTSVVCVGVSEYEHTGIPSVENAVRDTQTFAAFTRQAGVPKENITTLIGKDATRSKIIGAINNLKMSITEKSETAVFYFSGHGAPLIKNGKIYAGVIVPYDASEQSLEYTGIKLDLIKQMLGDLPGNSIIILDACFTGKEGRSLMAKNVKAIGLAPAPKTVIEPGPKNSWWLTATSGDNFANDLPKESHGLFTYYLLKALSGARGVDTDDDGLITITEAFAWTKEKVTNVSAKSLGRLQVPELIGTGDTILTIPR